MINKLEQIFWRKGKYVNKNNKEVYPKEIGEANIVILNYPFNEEEILKKSEKIILKKNYSSKINSYMICAGIEACYNTISEQHRINVSLEFCKI